MKPHHARARSYKFSCRAVPAQVRASLADAVMARHTSRCTSSAALRTPRVVGARSRAMGFTGNASSRASALYKFSCRAVPAQVRAGPCRRCNGTPHSTLHIIRRMRTPRVVGARSCAMGITGNASSRASALLRLRAQKKSRARMRCLGCIAGQIKAPTICSHTQSAVCRSALARDGLYR